MSPVRSACSELRGGRNGEINLQRSAQQKHAVANPVERQVEQPHGAKLRRQNLSQPVQHIDYQPGAQLFKRQCCLPPDFAWSSTRRVVFITGRTVPPSF